MPHVRLSKGTNGFQINGFMSLDKSLNAPVQQNKFYNLKKNHYWFVRRSNKSFFKSCIAVSRQRSIKDRSRSSRSLRVSSIGGFIAYSYAHGRYLSSFSNFLWSFHDAFQRPIRTETRTHNQLKFWDFSVAKSTNQNGFSVIKWLFWRPKERNKIGCFRLKVKRNFCNRF